MKKFVPILFFLQYRDFLAGRDISDEIVYHMSKSRCNIIVLSDNFLWEQWSDFELHRAHTENVLKNKKMIVIKFGKITYQNAPGLVKEILDCSAYMEWPQDESGKKSFEAVQKRQELFLAKLASRIYRHKGMCCRIPHENTGQLNIPIDDDATPMVDKSLFSL